MSPLSLSSPGARAARPVALVLLAMVSFQLGASLAKLLFPAVGANGATALRLTMSALILGVVARPWRGALPRSALVPLVAYGVALAGLNGFFYVALRTIPLGVAVAVDFIGPLGVAMAYSRRPVDLVWAGMAGTGIALLLPLGGAAPLDRVGLLFCLAAAACWAAYILAGRRLGAVMPSGRATALGIAIAAAITLPLGIAEAGPRLVAPSVLPVALLVAVLSSALPNTLEMMAMARIPARVFGVLMSLEPAMGALFGGLVLGEHLTGRQGLAIAIIIAASAGVTATAARPTPAAL